MGVITMLKLSIITPIYNVEKYLYKCLDSLTKQKISDYEIILIDDGSKDGSLNICREFEKKFNNIKVISQKNSGPGAARNNGIRMAKGKYLAFVDSDDFVDENMFEIMIERAEKYDLDMMSTAICMYYENGEHNKLLETGFDEDKIYSNYEIIELYMTKKISSFSSNKVFKREIFNNIKYPHDVNYEDIFTIFCALTQCKRSMFINKPLYYYRQHGSNLTRSYTLKDIKDFNSAVQLVNSAYEKSEFFNKSLLMSFNVSYFQTGIDLVIKNEQFKTKNIYKMCKNYYAELPDFKLVEVLLNKYINKKYKLIFLLFKIKLLPIIKKYLIMNKKKFLGQNNNL